MVRLAGLAMMFGASACAVAPTPYRAATGDGAGWSQKRIAEDHYLVTFRGNARTPRASLTQGLFFRAAELTLEQGHDSFVALEQSLDETGGRPAGDPGFDRVISRSYAHNLFGYISSLEFSVSSGAASGRHEAQVSIRMTDGAAPAPYVFDAREVIAALSASIDRPGPD